MLNSSTNDVLFFSFLYLVCDNVMPDNTTHASNASSTSSKVHGIFVGQELLN